MWQIHVKHNSRAIKMNYKLYLMEAFGLSIFMISACFFAGELWHTGAILNLIFKASLEKNLVMGVAMGLTALCIFYSPLTAPSGAHINPAVTLAQLYLGNISLLNALFYIIFQFAGGLIGVLVMSSLIGTVLTAAPVGYVATVPGEGISPFEAAGCELLIGFVMMTMVLNVSKSTLKKYTRVFAACLVSVYVFFAGPISGFGMNPARSFASALPSHNFNSFWIYLFCPVISMFTAAWLYKRFPLIKNSVQ